MNATIVLKPNYVKITCLVLNKNYCVYTIFEYYLNWKTVVR